MNDEHERDARGWVDLIDAADVGRMDSAYVEAEGLRLLVHRLAGDDYHVTSSQCPHEDFCMDRCALRGTVIICTEHGWEMDVRTGAVVAVGDEDARLPAYATEVRAGRVWAKLF